MFRQPSKTDLQSSSAKLLYRLSILLAIVFVFAGAILTTVTGNYIYAVVFIVIAMLTIIIFTNLILHNNSKSKNNAMEIKQNSYPITQKTSLPERIVRLNDYVLLHTSKFNPGEIYLENERKKIKKFIIKNHKIVDYPGVINTEEWISDWTSKKELTNWVRYRTEFQAQDNGTIKMIWQIQPDGRYWADEGGFGMENDEEINLYSYLDDEGRFLQPFQYYNGKII